MHRQPYAHTRNTIETHTSTTEPVHNSNQIRPVHILLRHICFAHNHDCTHAQPDTTNQTKIKTIRTANQIGISNSYCIGMVNRHRHELEEKDMQQIIKIVTNQLYFAYFMCAIGKIFSGLSEWFVACVPSKTAFHFTKIITNSFNSHDFIVFV